MTKSNFNLPTILLLSESEKEFLLEYCSKTWQQSGEQFTIKELISALVNDLYKEKLNVGKDEDGLWSLATNLETGEVSSEQEEEEKEEEKVLEEFVEEKSSWHITPSTSIDLLPSEINYFQANLIELANLGIISLSEESIDLSNPDPTDYLDYLDEVEMEIKKCLKTTNP